jgi:hypothetical protein
MIGASRKHLILLSMTLFTGELEGLAIYLHDPEPFFWENQHLEALKLAVPCFIQNVLLFTIFSNAPYV